MLIRLHDLLLEFGFTYQILKMKKDARQNQNNVIRTPPHVENKENLGMKHNKSHGEREEDDIRIRTKSRVPLLHVGFWVWYFFFLYIIVPYYVTLDPILLFSYSTSHSIIIYCPILTYSNPTIIHFSKNEIHIVWLLLFNLILLEFFLSFCKWSRYYYCVLN